MPATGETLLAMYEAMRRHFGPQNWWPASPRLTPHDRKLEICVGAILTQNTNWRNVERALSNLIDRGCMSVAALSALPPGELARRIRPAGYYNVKSRRLRNFLARIREGFAGDVEAFLDRPLGELRRDLLGISGVGSETADSIILYAAGKCTFVVDAYTARILRRHRLICEDADYEAIKALFQSHVPARVGLYKDYHAQLVAVGKAYCRPAARCCGCPLEPFDHDAGTER